MAAIKIGKYYITKNDPRFLLKKVAELTDENSKYKEVIDKINVFLDNHDINAGNLYYKYNGKYLLSEIKEDIRDILKVRWNK